MNLKGLPGNDKILWEGSQTDFVNLVEIFTNTRGFRNEQGLLSAEQVGDLFLKIFEIDISPYPDFASMRLVLLNDDALLEKVELMIDKVEEDAQFQEALEGTPILPSEETMQNEMFAHLFTQDFIQKLSKYVNFASE